jgi:WD40 repeat protein
MTGTILCRLEGHDAPIRDLAVSSKHTMLVSTGFDKSVKLWY